MARLQTRHRLGNKFQSTKKGSNREPQRPECCEFQKAKTRSARVVQPGRLDDHRVAGGLLVERAVASVLRADREGFRSRDIQSRWWKVHGGRDERSTRSQRLFGQ